MKRLVYVSTALALIASFSLTSGRSLAAHPAKALVNVRLCSSAPIGVPGDAHIVQGMFNGVTAATLQQRPKFKKAGMNLLVPSNKNDAFADGSAYSPAVEAQNAHACVDDHTVMGYIGTLNSGAAQASEPILNENAMVMISPANSNPTLTAPAQRKTYQPFTYNHKLHYTTYYRVVTTDALQGPAGALFVKNKLHIKNFYRIDDGQTYGVGLATHMAAYATAHLGMHQMGNGRVDPQNIGTTSQSVARNAVAAKPPVVYCGCDEPYAGPVLKALRRAGYTGYFVAGDAVVDPTFGHYAGGNANLTKTYASFVGNPYAVPSSFKNIEHRYFPKFSPGPYDALSYDASNIVLNAIYKAFKAGKIGKGSIFNQRAAVLPYVSGTRYHGTTGLTTFDHNGDTTNRVLTISVDSTKTGKWSLVQVVKGLPKYLKPTG